MVSLLSFTPGQRMQPPLGLLFLDPFLRDSYTWIQVALYLPAISAALAGLGFKSNSKFDMLTVYCFRYGDSAPTSVMPYLRVRTSAYYLSLQVL
jgi:hypothetical protein